MKSEKTHHHSQGDTKDERQQLLHMVNQMPTNSAFENVKTYCLSLLTKK